MSIKLDNFSQNYFRQKGRNQADVGQWGHFFCSLRLRDLVALKFLLQHIWLKIREVTREIKAFLNLRSTCDMPLPSDRWAVSRVSGCGGEKHCLVPSPSDMWAYRPRGQCKMTGCACQDTEETSCHGLFFLDGAFSTSYTKWWEAHILTGFHKLNVMY